jgi:hypothetical protein
MISLKRLPHLAKARTGFALASLACWAVLAFELGKRWPFLAENVYAIAAGLAGLGVASILFDRNHPPAPSETSAEDSPAAPDDGSTVQKLMELRHRGLVLIGAALILIAVVKARQAGPITKAPPAQGAPPSTVQVEIPPIILQGMTVSDGKPIALIDNGTYQIGDVIHGLRIVAITTRSVTVTYGDTTNVLQLGENRFQLTTENRLP